MELIYYLTHTNPESVMVVNNATGEVFDTVLGVPEELLTREIVHVDTTDYKSSEMFLVYV